MSDREVDALVVGGGPAGAATAIRLAEGGVSVLVLDKARFPREKACAEYYSPGAAAVLDRLGVGEAVARKGAARPSGMRVSAGDASFVLTYGNARALGLPRPELDAILLERAGGAGARVEEGTRVRGCLIENGRTSGALAERRGGTERIRARVVVGADGLHSIVSRSLGIPVRSPGPRRLGLVARYAGVSGVDRLGRMCVGNGRYCGIAPVGAGLVNVGLVVPSGEKRAGEALDTFFERSLSSVPGAREALRGGERVTPIRGMGPTAREPHDVAGPGFLLVGDAAGFLDPFTGEGVYRALRGGELAADAIRQGLSSGLDPGALYRSARQAEFAAKTRLCRLVQTFLCWPLLFAYLTRKLAGRGDLAARLGASLGDVAPAEEALRLDFILSVLRP